VTVRVISERPPTIVVVVVIEAAETDALIVSRGTKNTKEGAI